MEKQISDLDTKFSGMKIQISDLDTNFSEMKKQISDLDTKFDKNIRDLRADLDWQFEITTRSIIEKQMDESFSKCRVVRNFQDFRAFFYEICTKRMLNFLYDEKINFSIINSLDYIYQIESEDYSNKESSDYKLFYLYSKYRNAKEGLTGMNMKESKSFEINIQGRIDLFDDSIKIEIGEVKLTASPDSIRMAKIQLHPVLYILYYLLENIENKKIICYGHIYYGREKDHVANIEEDDIFYRFHKLK